MKVAKVSDIQNLADGAIIGEMTVQIKAAFAAKTGEGKYGPWRVQAAILKDDTGEVRASFWTERDIQKLVGKTVTIKSKASDKGLVGLKAKYSSHSSTNELDVSDKAEIKGDGLDAVSSYVAKATSSVSAPKVNEVASFDTEVDATKGIKRRAVMWGRCYEVASLLRERHDLTAEQFQALVSSLFISSDKAGLYNSFRLEDSIPAMVAEIEDEFKAEVGW